MVVGDILLSTLDFPECVFEMEGLTLTYQVYVHVSRQLIPGA